MTGRERIKANISGEPADRCGLWLGQPHKDTRPIYYKYFGADSLEDIRQQLGDDLRWIGPKVGTAFSYTRQNEGSDKCKPGCLSNCHDVGEVESLKWPNPDDLELGAAVQQLRQAGDFYRLSGVLSMFFHADLIDFLGGMENYFVRMYTDPDVVHAITRRVIDFYLGINRRFFEAAGDLMDGFFISNDFGTQLDLMISPDNFEEFIFPYLKELFDLGHEYGYQVILHSCGAVYKILPRLIELGADALHPAQAKAINMDAETLTRFKGKIAFIGGIDTQDLLVNGSPQDIKDDVERVRNLLAPYLVISPSHEAILPNVPPENIKAMAEAAVNCG